MKTVILLVIVVLVVATFSYRLLPFRNAGKRRPFLAFLPKYKKLITSKASDKTLEQKLAQYGFKKKKQKGTTAKFTRGSVLGDLSIELSKIDVDLKRLNDEELELTVQAGWIAVFDTGDHWKLITRLGEELERA